MFFFADYVAFMEIYKQWSDFSECKTNLENWNKLNEDYRMDDFFRKLNWKYEKNGRPIYINLKVMKVLKAILNSNLCNLDI